MEKASDVFLEHFARLGVISKVSEIAGPLQEEENEDDEIDGATSFQDKKVCSNLENQFSDGGMLFIMPCLSGAGCAKGV